MDHLGQALMFSLQKSQSVGKELVENSTPFQPMDDIQPFDFGPNRASTEKPYRYGNDVA